MPYASFKILPGVDQNKTPALNEAAVSESQLIRFIPDRTLGGLVQKLGGWTKYFNGDIGSIIRALWAWEDTNANSYLAIGAEGLAPANVTNATGDGTTVTLTHDGGFSFLTGYGVEVSGIDPAGYNGTYTVTGSTSTTVSYASAETGAYVSGGLIAGGGGSLEVIDAGVVSDITPQTTTVNVAVDFETTAGQAEVTVTDVGRNADDYDVVNIQTQVSIGGLILFGLYPIKALGPDTYQIIARDIFGDPQPATSSSTTAAVPEFFATTSSDFVTVYLENHNLQPGDTFPVLVATSVGGITLFGNYVVREVTDANEFVISASTTAASIPVTGASGTGTVVTITHASGITFTNGEDVEIAGVNPAGYNGTEEVTTSTDGSFTYAGTETGAYVSGGRISGEFSFFENGGDVRFVYYNGIGPLPEGSGFGINEYGEGGYGTGIPPIAGTGVPINAVDWTLDNWGETLVACPLSEVDAVTVGGPIYTWNPTFGDPVAQVIAGCPTVNEGMFVAMPQRQIVAWGSTFTGISDPLLIRWSDVNDYTQWIALLTNQAGSYRIPKGSRIIQCIQGPQQGLIWTDLAVWAMQYAGPPYIYQFNELGTGCGLIGRKAAGSVNGVVYWMGSSQFFRLAGNGVEPIRCPVWDVVFQDLDLNNLDKIRIAPNSRFGEIAWFYPTQSNGGEVSHYVKYNFILDQWDYGALARTAWINESVLGPPIGAAPDTYIYQHETSPDADGQPMLSSFQTGYFAMTEGNVKMFVDQVWPDMKWGYYGGTQGANVKITFFVTDFPGQTPEVYGPFTMTQASTYFTTRFRGRLVSIKIESDDIGSFWRLGNIRYRLQEDGRF